MTFIRHNFIIERLHDRPRYYAARLGSLMLLDCTLIMKHLREMIFDDGIRNHVQIESIILAWVAFVYICRPKEAILDFLIRSNLFKRKKHYHKSNIHFCRLTKYCTLLWTIRSIKLSRHCRSSLQSKLPWQMLSMVHKQAFLKLSLTQKRENNDRNV